MKKLKKLLTDFIDWRWVGVFLLIPTLVIIIDENIMDTWIFIFYVIFAILIVSGFVKYIYDKRKSN